MSVNKTEDDIHNFSFQHTMSIFLENPALCLAPQGKPLIHDLIYSWGNKAWTASDEYLLACIEHTLVSEGPVLECGSGLTTLLLGAVCKQRGIPYFALEHKQASATKVQNYLNYYGIESVFLFTKPIKNYGQFCWYDPPLDMLPDEFKLVICDGPPYKTKGGRVGLVPIMKEKLKHGSIILLDDAWRIKEAVIAKYWSSSLKASCDNLGHERSYIKLNIL